MITFHWADKVFTASLLVKIIVFTVSLTLTFQFFRPYFFFSIQALIILTKTQSCSVNTVGSLLMLEPDDGVVGQLKDEDKDRKDWKLGKIIDDG